MHFLFLFFIALLFPSLINALATKIKWVDFLGTVFFCYLGGILWGNIMPEGWGRQEETDPVSGFLILLAIPLTLFNTDTQALWKVAPRAIFSYFLGLISVMLVGISSSFLFKDLPHLKEITAMIVAVYVGATANMAGVAKALDVSENLFAQVNFADMVTGGIYLLLLMTIAPKIARKCLHHVEYAYDEILDDHHNEALPKNKSVEILSSLVIAFVTFGLAVGISFALHQKIQDMTLVISVTILGFLGSRIEKIRKMSMNYLTGEYLLMMFCFLLGTLSDFEGIFNKSMDLFIFMAIVMMGSVFLHGILAKIFKIDADLYLISSTAGIFGPPFIAPVAKAMKNPGIIPLGMATAILGVSLGTLMGLLAAWIVSLF